MASIHKSIELRAAADHVWRMLRDVGAAHKLFAGVLTNCSLEGDLRTVTFANGMVVSERIVDVDDDRRRVAYAVVGGMFTQHGASMQVQALDAQRCRFVWTSDFLPAEAAATVRPLVELGTEALRGIVEQQFA